MGKMREMKGGEWGWQFGVVVVSSARGEGWARQGEGEWAVDEALTGHGGQNGTGGKWGGWNWGREHTNEE
jgi:hypothetical protein